MMNIAYAAVAGLAIVTAIGTYERSALIGLVMLGLYMFVRSRRKFAFSIVAGAIVIALIVGTAASSNARVSTIGDYSNEGSAMTRIMVWEWTLGYSVTHPLGGSFDAYGVNSIVVPGNSLNPAGSVENGRAWHSIYFEVLGELGWPGLFMFLLAGGSSIFSLLRLSRKCRNVPDLVWVADMSDAVQSGMLVFLTSGAFVGIAFIPSFWYFVSMGICLRAYVWHAERAENPDLKGWRLAAQRTRETLVTPSPGWQKPSVLPGEPAGRAPGWHGATRARRGDQ